METFSSLILWFIIGCIWSKPIMWLIEEAIIKTIMLTMWVVARFTVAVHNAHLNR